MSLKEWFFPRQRYAYEATITYANGTTATVSQWATSGRAFLQAVKDTIPEHETITEIYILMRADDDVAD
jgi:hypothetical protein